MNRRSSTPRRAITTHRASLRLLDLENRIVPASYDIANGDVADLIAKINLCNSTPEADTINLAANGLYNLTAVATTADGGCGLPTITAGSSSNPQNTLTINGNNATIQRDTTITVPDFRLLRVIGGTGTSSTAFTSTLTLNNLNLKGGQFKTSTTYGGGALLIGLGGIVIADGCTFTNCSTQTNGGAIYVSSSGGSLAGPGQLTMQNSFLQNNQSTNGHGGAVFTQGSLTMIGCTIADNRAAAGSGGGVFQSVSSSSLFQNCTFSGNIATQGGGYNQNGSASSADLQFCTITGNSATANFGAGMGGGIYAIGTLTLSNTVVAGNTGVLSGVQKPSDINSSSVNSISSTYNFVGVNNGVSNLINGQNGNSVGTQSAPIYALLGALQYNGGRTPTRLPLAGSPLINTGNPSPLNPPANDQRGSGYPRIVSGRADIGAVEVGSISPATFVVSNTSDSGPGSLRQAIQNSNNSPGALDTITFQAGISGTILLSSTLNISDSVVITGPGSNVLTISGNNANRIFNIDAPGIYIETTISGLALTNGNSSTLPDASSGSGGAIHVADETLTLNDVVITNCTAGSWSGGAIGAGQSGEGWAWLIIRNSTISGNTALNGGGIYFWANGSLNLENSTISGNTATSGTGGGIYFWGTVDTPGFNIRNSTISGNSATSGAGIALQSLSGTVSVRNSTLTSNNATTTGTTAGQGGGGIALLSAASGATPILNIASSIVSGNSASNGRADVAAATPSTVNLNFSAVGSGTGFTLSAASGNNLPFSATLNLLPLANNGGRTRTHALGFGSSAINAGSNPDSLTTDQRGPGYVRVAGATADIGAFEVQPPRVAAVQVNGGVAQRSLVKSITVRFDSIVSFNGSVAAAFQLSRIGGSAIGGFTATSSTVNNVTVVTLSNFTGSQTQFGSLINGRYTLTVLGNQVTSVSGALDGAGTGTAGTNYVLNGTTANGLYRNYGDLDGNGTVDGDDLAIFVSTLFNPGNYVANLDYDNNGSIDGDDLAQFVQNLFVPL